MKVFLKINRNLSEEKQKRYDELTEKRLAATLTEKERAELGELIQESERIWAERLRAVVELARLRKVSPEEMMRQLELDPRVKVSKASRPGGDSTTRRRPTAVMS